jgi:phage-related minor tail protein
MTVEADQLRQSLADHVKGCEEQWRVSIKQSENVITRLGALEKGHEEFSGAVLDKLDNYNRTAWIAVGVILTAILTGVISFIVGWGLQNAIHPQPYMTTTKDFYHDRNGK